MGAIKNFLKSNPAKIAAKVGATAGALSLSGKIQEKTNEMNGLNTQPIESKKISKIAGEETVRKLKSGLTGAALGAGVGLLIDPTVPAKQKHIKAIYSMMNTPVRKAVIGAGTGAILGYSLSPEKKASDNDLIPGTPEWIKSRVRENKEIIYKEAVDASYYDFGENGKIQAIEDSFDLKLEKDIAYMIATSHEYKKPNTKSAITFVKNYKWELDDIALSKLEGINKPVIKEKVLDMAKKIKIPKPLIVVNQFHGIRPQTPGKKILIDGHHRKEAYEFKGLKETPIFKGTYTGAAELPITVLTGEKEMNIKKK